MLEDQVANLLQSYLGNYVRGLNKEALNISVWKGDVELTNMQLKPEALNALKLPVKVKAGFLGSVKLKVPWSRLGQEPVLVSLDRIFLLAQPSTGVEGPVEGCSEDSVQEAKKSRVREMEMRLLERAQQLKSEVNQSWLGSLINTIIGNLKLSISNIHIRYEDLESNPGCPFAMGLTLEKLIAVTVDDNGKETFVTGGSLERIQKSVELEQIALYLDSGISPWQLDKPWENLLPAEWVQVFRFGTDKGMPANKLTKKHTYILQPVTGNAKYVKSRPNEHNDQQPLQKAAVNLDDVTLCLSKDGYRDMLKLADNFAAFNQRLKYTHFRPPVSIKSNPSSWWKYAYRAVSDQLKKASGKLSWEQVLKYAKLRKKYISLYAQLLKSDPSRAIADDNKEIEELDRELDIEVILQWRMLAHKFVERSVETGLNLRKQKEKKSWWSIGWSRPSLKDESEAFHFSEEDWDQLNRIIGYKEEDAGQSVIIDEKKDSLHTLVEIHMKHNASKLIDESLESLAALSCESLNCSIKLYPETKIFDIKLGSYQLSSPNGLLAESATSSDSLVGIFCYKPFDAKVDWSMVAKASPCYVTYLKDSIEQVVKFFEDNSGVSQKIALETAAAVQMTIDEVKRTAQQQMNRALKDHSRFLLDLDIAAPKITIPTDFRPDDIHPTKLLLDLGNLIIRTGDDNAQESTEETLMYLQFKLVLSDVSAFLVDGDYFWSQTTYGSAGRTYLGGNTFLPIIDRCGVILALDQNRLEDPSYPSTRIAVRLPSLGFHFSPARYHRLMQVLKIFQGEDSDSSDSIRPWSQADLEGWLSLLVRKGMGNREAVWQRRYLCLVGPFLYVLDSPGSRSYKQYISLRGKQVFQVPAEFVGGVDHVLAVSEAARSNSKVVEDANALIMRCDTDELWKLWQRRLRGAIYRASGSAPIVGLSESSSELEDSEKGDYNSQDTGVEKVFITGILDELKICFYCNHQRVQGFMRVLVAEENRLFEFRAIGGQVELSVRASEMLIGTVLRSLEIEDLVSSNGISKRRYLARSFIGSADVFSPFDDVKSQSFNSDDRAASEGDDKFYEAPESLADPVDSPMQSSMSVSDNQRADLASTSQTLSLKPPSFIRTPGLLPYDTHETKGGDSELKDTLNSFVKAQIIVLDHNSALYNNIDKQVTVTLATLSFFCRRPTILAIMEFVNAINTEDEKCESFSESSSVAIIKHDTHGEDVGNDHHSEAVEESVVKGLLGKGKSRIIFSLTLKMTRAQIILMNEKEAKFATLLQDNLLADIKVFPSSFRIKAALGNLRISDDSLPSNHMYFWICDMRNPGGSSFVDLLFSSFSSDDEDYEGYDYALVGELSEVRVVYLNRFIQEIVSYFTGLAPGNSKNVVKVKDQVTDAEKWFTTSEIEGSPAVKLDLSLRKPIIWMPRRTDSIDYLKLDIVQITVQNSFQWIFGSKREISAVHLDILTILIEDINLNVGVGTELGESIIQEVKGVSVVIRRSLRDLLHRVPGSEVTIKIEEIKAALSNREYQIITECAQANFSETPNLAPSLIDSGISSSEADALVPQVSDVEYATQDGESWITTKVSVAIDLVVLCLRTGIGGDTSLATVGVNGMWLLYKSNEAGDGFLSASLDGFTVIDDRVGTEEGLRLAIGKPEDIRNSPINAAIDYKHWSRDYIDAMNDNDVKIVPTMLILEAKFSQSSSFMSLCVQRPQLLVALDFLLAVVEFFVPSIGDVLSHGDREKSLALNIVDAVTLDQSVYRQPSAEMALSPQRPLIVDDERYNHFIYDGQGGTLYLKDRQGTNLSAPSKEKMIYVANGKKLQLKNVIVKDGRYLDSCIYLGTNSSYTASKDDHVYLEEIDGASCGPCSKEDLNQELPPNNAVVRSTEFTVELQAIGPELTFYSASKEVAESRSLILSNKLLHAQLDVFCRLVMKNDTIEMSANALGLTMESNGIRILEPFDTTLNYSNASGKTNIQLTVSDVFMNFSFSILKLFLAVEEDILAFLRMTSKKITVVCSQFDKVGTVRNPQNGQVYVFWRPRAPPGFAVLGDYLTPTEKPPTKGVIAINTNFARVKNPLSFRLVWPNLSAGVSSEQRSNGNEGSLRSILDEGDTSCCVWFPEVPKGYVALGCVVSRGRKQPPLSSVSCILASLVTPCPLRDCITIGYDNLCSTLAFWRVENAAGTFLPADPTTGLLNVAYELRHLMFPILDSPKAYESPNTQASFSHRDTPRPQRSIGASSCRRFEVISDFVWVWWNRGSNSGRRLSIWRPVVPQGMVYFGDIAVQGYEPPSTCTVLYDTGGEELFRAPLDFQLVGQIKKQKGVEGISFWMPQAPPGYVSLGCVASKSIPKQHDFSALRCIRSDMVSGDQFSEESLWDTSGTKIKTEPFSIWAIGNELGTFIVRSGFKKPPRRFALKLADLTNGLDDTVIDAEIKTFSAALFDDYGGLIREFSIARADTYRVGALAKYQSQELLGLKFKEPRFLKLVRSLDIPKGNLKDMHANIFKLERQPTSLILRLVLKMVPLFNVSLSGLGFSLHGREKCINSTASFSLNVRSYNDKYEAWEPVVEPVDGFLRYQYDLNAPGAVSQLRIASRRDFNLNVSVSNANMIIQAYASWSNLSHVHKSNQEIQKEEAVSSTFGGGSIIGVHHKRDFFFIPRNKLGQDIFIRATEIMGLDNIIRMPSGDMKPLKVPVLKNMLDSHMKGKLGGKVRAMVTVLVADAQILRAEGSTSKQYAVTIRLIQDQSISSESLLKQQTARTRGIGSEHSSSSKQELVNWGEMFFFKVDSPDHYKVELIVIDTGNGNPVGFSSFPLKQVAENIPDSLSPSAYFNKLSWMDLFSAQSMNTVEETEGQKLCGRLRCGILLSPEYEVENQENSCMSGKRSGFIQISPSREGPWTTVGLNYAAPAACWRLGNDVIASEVIVKDGDRYVDIRSLVTVRNSTDITLDLCLKSKASEDRTLHDASRIEVQQFEDDKTEKDEFFQTEEYKPSTGWVSCSFQPKKQELGGNPWNEKSISESPPGWSWIDDWHLDKTSVTTADGWVYAPDVESLKWPESCDSLKYVNYARQRKWVRNRKKISGHQKLEISLGRLSPGDTVPLPLSGLLFECYVLQLRPFGIHDSNEYSWSSVVNKVEDSGEPKGISEICVSALAESNELLYCTPLNGTSSNGSQKLWFCVSIQATELAKDIHLDPIQDWKIVIKAPLSLTNFLPFAAEFNVLEMQAGDHFSACARGTLCPGAPVNVYHADIRNPLFLSLLPQRGWLPVHETILLSHPHGVPANTMSLRSAISGRIVQIILDQNYEREQPMLSKVIRVYAPYWFEIARCPPLTLRFIDMGGKKSTRKFALPFHSEKSNAKIVEEIAEEEIYDGHTIASALNFNVLGLSVSSSGEGHFGPVKDLSLLGDMDGSLDINAYDADGKCVKLFVSTKPCPYQSMPTKVICIRPFITFTNRLGQDVLLKLSCGDEAKVLHLCDSRVSFSYCDDNGPNKLQVRLGDTEWSYPIQITKEDTISLVLRTRAGIRKFVRTEIRGYEEGSRFIVVFRLGSAFGPIRMENRIGDKKISIRQAGFDDNYWIQMEPFSTTNFSWEDPYGQKFIEAKVDEGSSGVWKFDLEESGLHLVEQGELKIKFHVFEMVDVKVGRFIDDKTSNLDEDMLITSTGNQGSTQLPAKVQNEATPLELIVELGVLGVSLIDHRPKELSYLYLERVFISYSTSYDGGTTTRFKLILGYLQIDNQLPLTLMPVLLAPEQATDLHHPVFKITVTVCNENPDGIVVYPCVYIRVTDKWWRLDIHEPIIWAVVDLFHNIQMDRLPQTSSVTQVDPEIRVNLTDISEVRLKVSLETAPAQRPHGVLGVWSPVLSAVGNAFKIQLHLRRVMHKDRFMRKSSILPAIGNRIMRDLIHNPLHLLFSVDVLGMASSTLASLSRGFAELSTDGQFLQLRSKQVRSRRITGVSDGILQGTEALAQGVAFGVSGVVTKPMESAKQNGLLGLAHGVGRAFVGIVVQPVSGALDFFSMTVYGIGASCSKCLEVLNRKTSFNRIRNPRAIRSDGIVRDYCEREALGQTILYLAEASRRFGCTEIFKEPSKFAWSDYYEEHFVVPYQRIVLVTNKRVMLLQCPDLDNMDKRPCKIMWDVSWQELMALELAKAGCNQPSHLILHLKIFRRSENFVRVIKCATEVEIEGTVPQAVTICSVVRKMWKAYQSDMKCVVLKVPSSQRHVSFAWSEADGRETLNLSKAIVRSREFSSSNSVSDDRKFVKHSINFTKIWSSERETKGRCPLCRKQSSDHSAICSIWKPICPDGYVSIGDIARVGNHPPNCAAVYSNSDRLFALPIGYDLVWRNCFDDYTTPVSIWHPRAPEGFVSLGCVAVPDFTEPQPDLVYCVAESLAEQTEFEEQKIWTEPDSYPWACHIYQIKSDALHFVALRQTKEESDWTPMRVHDEPAVQMRS